MNGNMNSNLTNNNENINSNPINNSQTVNNQNINGLNNNQYSNTMNMNNLQTNPTNAQQQNINQPINMQNMNQYNNSGVVNNQYPNLNNNIPVSNNLNSVQNQPNMVNNTSQINNMAQSVYQNQPMNSNNKFKRIDKRIFIIGGAIAAIIVTIVLCLVLFKDKDKNLTRTVMIYMVGADLESKNGLATVDLNSIDYDKMDNENVNVVLIAGGSEDWNNNYIDKDETSIYEVTHNGFEKVKTQNIQNMGDSKVFSNFLNYVYENYKTDEYELIFWNHGAAIYGSEFDELTEDFLSLDEMKKGLENSNFKGENKLEIIIFRTCLNGTIEVADTLKNYSEYLVASEEITLGSSYTSVLNFINDIEPTDDGYDIGLKFIESYKQQIKALKNLSSEYIYSTYSIVDLDKIDELVNSLNEFVSDIDVVSNYNKIAKVRSNLYQYAYAQSDDPSYDMVDLYNLVEGIKDLSPDKANKVLKNIENTVLYNWATNSKSRGISIYFPYNADSDVKKYLLNIYNNLDSFNKYNSFITNFNSIQTNGNKSFSFEDNKTLVKSNNEKSDFTLELTDEQVNGYARAEYLVFMDKGEGYYWPVYKGKDVNLNGNILNASINNNAFKIVDDGDEYLLPLIETYNNEDYIKYIIYGTIEDISSENISDWKIENIELSLILDKTTKKITVGNAIVNNSVDLPNTVVVNLDEWQYISFGATSRKLVDENGNVDMDLYQNSSNGVYEGVQITIDELANFKLTNFNDGNGYYCTFKIYDVDNNYYYSKLIKMN